MLEVAEVHPRLLRVTTLDRFDGLRFLRSATPPGTAQLEAAGDPQLEGFRAGEDTLLRVDATSTVRYSMLGPVKMVLSGILIARDSAAALVCTAWMPA